MLLLLEELVILLLLLLLLALEEFLLVGLFFPFFFGNVHKRRQRHAFFAKGRSPRELPFARGPILFVSKHSRLLLVVLVALFLFLHGMHHFGVNVRVRILVRRNRRAMVRWHRANGRKGFIFVVADAHEVIIVLQRNVSLQQALMVLFNHFVRWSEIIIVCEIISCL